MKKPVFLSWSGGKDSALALHSLRASGDFEPAGLLTTINEDYGRVSIHGVRRELLERQAESIGLPLHQVLIPKDCPNAIYEERLAAVLRAQDIRQVAFGDLFLEDIRCYREKQMAALGLSPVFPLWGLDTARLARLFLSLGFQAVLVCVDAEQLAPSFVGRSFDQALLRDLPAGVDPCGENGEFHTFVHAGPIFREPIGIALGRVEERGQFWFQELRNAVQAQADPVRAQVISERVHMDTEQVHMEMKQAPVDIEQVQLRADQAPMDTERALMDTEQALLDS